MAYTLHLEMPSRSDLPTQSFLTVDGALDAAVKLKAACTEDECKKLVMRITDDEGRVMVANTEINEAYRHRRPWPEAFRTDDRGHFRRR